MIIDNFPILCGLLLVVLVARNIGNFGNKLGLALISGFILTGVLAGPYVLGIVSQDSTAILNIIDAVALPFIALTAGAELRLEELRRRLSTIVTILAGILLSVTILGAGAFLLFSETIPFMQGKPFAQLFAIALLGANICLAKSPSSTIAVIKEVRAKGPFTQTALGVTILLDAVVVLLFATSDSFADVVFRGADFKFSLVLLLIFEIGLDILTGVLLAYVLRLLLAPKIGKQYKSILILLLGYTVSNLSIFFHHQHLWFLPLRLFSEPLLVCMVAGFMVSNYTTHQEEFSGLLEEVATPVFLIFFTALGVGIELDILQEIWHVILALVFVRALAMSLGTYFSSRLVGDRSIPYHMLGLAFVTQAGLSLGLAKQVGINYPAWGAEFTTLLTAVIVINTLIGPSFFKFALHHVGETHSRGAPPEPDPEQEVIIFGIEDQSLLLARQLQAHGWRVKLADIRAEQDSHHTPDDIEVQVIPNIRVEELKKLGAEHTDAMVVMLDNDTSYKICELAYEHFGTPNLVVRLDGRETDILRFQEIGVSVVDSQTALISLLEHYVRSPSSISLLLGQESHRDVIEIVVGNPSVHGVALRDLRLPNDILIMMIRRGGQLLLSHGYNRLLLGDQVTIVGDEGSLVQVQARLEGA